MIRLLYIVYGVFGDREGVAHSLQPHDFHGVSLAHVTPLLALRKHWASDKYTGDYGGARVFIKTTGVSAEYAYHQVGILLGFAPILLPAAFDLTQQLMIAPFVKTSTCGADAECRNNCANPERGVRHAMLAALDYVMGYIDRPMNCHYVGGQVFAIDNDSMTDGSMQPARVSNDYQWQYVPDRVPLRSLCTLHLVPRSIDLPGVNTTWIAARYNHLLHACAS